MIEINLLPHELKTRLKESEAAPPLFLYFIPLVFIILIIMHAVLGVMTMSGTIRLNTLTQSWSKFEEQRKQLESFKQQAGLVSQDVQGVQDLMSRYINWSEKLYLASLHLPSGVWCNELAIKGAEFSLRGSVISLEKIEVPIINKFLDALKSDMRFSKDFSDFSLGPFKRKTAGSYEVVDFIITGAVNKL